MAARRCSDCGINYPVRGHVKCDGCGSKTDLISNATVSENWREEAETVRTQLEEAAQQVEKIPKLKIKLYERDGFFFISSWDVINAGLRHTLVPDTLLRIVKSDDDVRLFEVAGYSRDRREYWLVPVEEVHEFAEDDVRVRQPLMLNRGDDLL